MSSIWNALLRNGSVADKAMTQTASTWAARNGGALRSCGVLSLKSGSRGASINGPLDKKFASPASRSEPEFTRAAAGDQANEGNETHRLQSEGSGQIRMKILRRYIQK